MSVETRLQNIIGQQAMTICVLQEQIDTLVMENKALKEKGKGNEIPVDVNGAGTGPSVVPPSDKPHPRPARS